jgi:hypothetical protein
MVTWENYEEYMLLHADGELEVAEERELMAFVAQHPELRGELELYATVKLTPDTTVVYADKAALLKPVPAKKVMVFPMWQRYSIAAGVAAILFLSVWKFREAGVEQPVVEQTNTVSIPAAVKPQPATVPEAPIAAPAQVKQQEIAVATKHEAPVKIDRVKNEVVAAPKALEVVAIKEQLEELVPVEAKVMPVESTPVERMALNNVPALNKIDNREARKTLLEALPIEDIKKEGISDMANALALTYRKMSALKHTITDEKNITVRIEKNQLKLSF